MSVNHPVKRSPSLLCVSIWESVRSDDSSHCKDFVGGSDSQESSWSQEVYFFGESWALIRAHDCKKFVVWSGSQSALMKAPDHKEFVGQLGSQPTLIRAPDCNKFVLW